jgi:hypothetical protein
MLPFPRKLRRKVQIRVGEAISPEKLTAEYLREVIVAMRQQP